MPSERQLRDWIQEHGLVLRRSRYTLGAAEVGLPHLDEPPQQPLPGFGAMLAQDGVPYKVDLVGWQHDHKADGVVLAELKIGPAQPSHVLQIVSYMNYLRWMLRHLPQPNLEVLAKRIGYPRLQPNTPVTGLLVAAEFDYDLWWSVPPLRGTKLILVRHDIDKETRGKADGIKHVRFLDFTRKMREHWR
jgi:hypothetical protein